MNTQIEIEEENLRLKDNVVPFARPDPKPPGTGPDWLRQLDKNCRFLAKQRGIRGPLLTAYGIAVKTPKAVLLAEDTGVGLTFIWVDSQLFSSMNEFYELLPEPDKEAGQLQEEEHDGDHPPGPADGSDNDVDEGLD